MRRLVGCTPGGRILPAGQRKETHEEVSHEFGQHLRFRSKSCGPGGSVAKPLIIALLALLAARYFGGKGGDDTAKPTSAPAPRIPQPQSQPDAVPDPGSILDGLGGLIKQFQQKGLGDAIDSWVNTGANKDISSASSLRGASDATSSTSWRGVPGFRVIR